MQKDNFIILMAIAVVLVMGFWYFLSNGTPISTTQQPAPVVPITADNGGADQDLAPGTISADLEAAATACVEAEGFWLEEFGECEDVTSDWCEQMEGIFDECASACRHLEDAEMCIMQCVPVCYFR